MLNMLSSAFALFAASAGVALAEANAWAQCGGQPWTGSTSCVSGYSCYKINDYYHQCQPATASPQPRSAMAEGGSTTSISARDDPPWFFGINLSGADFAADRLPGREGTDYTWYNKNSIDTLMSKGINHFRVNFLMERLTPDSLTGAYSQNYLDRLNEQVSYITGKGAYAMIQPHNYGRYYDNIITDISAFKTWWQNLAVQHKDNPLVVFDTNNEFHDMSQQLVFDLNQAAIDGIRAAGATTQWITPEGGSWSSAWTWVSSGNGATLIRLSDPSNKLIFKMQQYLDYDGSGTHGECVSSTVFRELLQEATLWLRENGQLGLIGEYAGGDNEVCKEALVDGLAFMRENRDVWTGHFWWAAGPWWGDYMFSMEPGTGVAYNNILPSLLPYAK